MSNKTLENNAEKIESELKKPDANRAHILLLVILAVTILGFFKLAYTFLNDKRVVINGYRFDVLVVDTATTREKGLSGRPRIKKNQGMLFRYSESGEYCIWMKDMKFNIDVIWIDKSNKVVAIKENLAPESYPEAFCPNSDSIYILEVPAGAVSEHSITIGSQVSIGV